MNDYFMCKVIPERSVCLEVTLYPGMSILKKSADLTPTPRKGEGNYANLKVHSHSVLTTLVLSSLTPS
jgi:hypothetical protein